MHIGAKCDLCIIILTLKTSAGVSSSKTSVFHILQNSQRHLSLTKFQALRRLGGFKSSMGGGERSRGGIGPFAKSKCWPCSKRTSQQTCLPLTALPVVASKCKSGNILADNPSSDCRLAPFDSSRSSLCNSFMNMQKRTQSQRKEDTSQNEPGNVCTKKHICKVIVLSLRSDARSQPTHRF